MKQNISAILIILLFSSTSFTPCHAENLDKESVPVYLLYQKSGNEVLHEEDSPGRLRIEEYVRQILTGNGIVVNHLLSCEYSSCEADLKKELENNNNDAAAIFAVHVTGDMEKKVTSMFQGIATIDLALSVFQFEKGNLTENGKFELPAQVMPIRKWKDSREVAIVQFDKAASKVVKKLKRKKHKSALVRVIGSFKKMHFAMNQVYGDDIPTLLEALPGVPSDNSKWLLVIGIENYDRTDPIRYSRRSSEQFIQVARKTLGIPPENIFSMVDQDATAGRIKDEFNLLKKRVKKGDTIYFYYSGHGIPVLPDYEPYLLPKDKVPDLINSESYFKLVNIYHQLSETRAGKVVAFIDSCFSGATDDKTLFKDVAAGRLAAKKVKINRNKMVVITAAQGKQFSNAYPKRKHRLFSYFLMKSLIRGERDVNALYKEIHDNVTTKSNVLGKLKFQEPTIEGNRALEL